MDETKTKLLFDFHSKTDVAENFSLDELLNFARQKNLQEWLAVNFYSGDARKVAEVVNSSDAEMKLLLCKIFNLSPESLSASDAEEIIQTVNKNHRRELFAQKLPDDDRKLAFVETQGELVTAINDGAQLIYLCGGEFKIPLNKRGVTYIGCENAVVDIDEEFCVDLDDSEIVLENLQVYLHHAIDFKAEKSKNIKILDGSKKFLTPVTLKEIFNILRGRKSFETRENFKQRAENLLGVAVGGTLLDEKIFDIDSAQFAFKPQWNFDYISVIKDFSAGKNFSVTIRPADAEALYANERKLQIFADFTCRGGKLTIKNLYFETKTLGKVPIKMISRTTAGSSSMFGLGYGLEIITDYVAPDTHQGIITDYVAPDTHQGIFSLSHIIHMLNKNRKD